VKIDAPKKVERNDSIDDSFLGHRIKPEIEE